MVRAILALTAGAGLALSPPRSASAEPAALEAVCPVAWHGVPLSEALGPLAGRLGTPYILDSAVDTEALNRRIRMSASHLTGEQAFRWLCRSAGLEAVLVEGTFLIAPENRLPTVWRARGKGEGGLGPDDDARRRLRQAQRADIGWVDAPLSGVAEDIAVAFGVDTVFHPAVLADQGLIYFEASQSSLDQVCRVLAEQLRVDVRFVDGAMWVCPAGAAPEPPLTMAADGGRGRESAAGPLDRPVSLDRSVATWSAFAARLAGAGGVEYRLEMPPETPCPAVDATGSVGAVLDAARLLGWVSWSFGQANADRRPVLTIRVRQAG